MSLTSLAMTDITTLDSCSTQNECVIKFSEVAKDSATPGQYSSDAELKIINKLLSLENSSLPLLIDLLESDDKLIARNAAIALGKIEKIDDKYLPNIIKAINNKVNWISHALPNINSPQAAETAIKNLLTDSSSPHNQWSYSIKQFGEKAFPYILKAAKCEYSCDRKTYYSLSYVLEIMDVDKSRITKQLFAIVNDTAYQDAVRANTLRMIGHIGPQVLNLEDDIFALRDKEAFLTEPANTALIAMKSKYAGQILSELLEKQPDLLLFRDMAEVGIKARNGGPTLVRLLNHNSAETRLLAARTIGFIGYKEADIKLLQMLRTSRDVQFDYVAVESLGKLKSKAALEALRQLSNRHWHPVVQKRAKYAIKEITSSTPIQDERTQTFNSFGFGWEFLSFTDFDTEVCENISLKKKAESTSKKLYRSTQFDAIEKLKYTTFTLSYGANDEDAQQAEDPDAIIRVHEGNLVEHRREHPQLPNHALKVSDGWLVGSNRGEWGGELVHLTENKEQTILLKENIEDTYQLGNRYIALTGLSHMMSNSGYIYEIFQDKTGRWQTEPWLRLPGAPRSSWLVETGEILINTSGGGSILLSLDGEFRMAECVTKPTDI